MTETEARVIHQRIHKEAWAVFNESTGGVSDRIARWKALLAADRELEARLADAGKTLPPKEKA
jgi:hypothetical protein